MMKLTDLAPSAGATHKRKRVGRGNGSGHGTYCCRGLNGHKSRSGYKHKAGFEGGQMPLQRRMPKRGFFSPFKIEYSEVSFSCLKDFPEGTEITPELLWEKRITRKKNQPVKLLADGVLNKKLTIRLHAASAKAVEKVTAAGGTFEKVTGAKVSA